TLLCPTGWESHGLKCYKLSHQVSNFLNAKKYCHDLNSEMIMPKTEEENKIVKKLLYQVKFENSSEWDGIWIGLTDIANEGKWIWNDGTKLDSEFNDWDSDMVPAIHPTHFLFDVLAGEEFSRFLKSSVPLIGPAKNLSVLQQATGGT
ncbi:low affinity immunoglobulin epsilon Fc receptor, partial [Mytilus galloprovincialis]